MVNTYDLIQDLLFKINFDIINYLGYLVLIYILGFCYLLLSYKKVIEKKIHCTINKGKLHAEIF